MLTYLLIIITLYLAGNAYIFIRAKQALKVKSLGVKIFLTVLFWICALSFFGTMLTRNLEMPVFISHSMYTIGTSWLIFTLYMALFLLLFDILKLFKVVYKYRFYLSLVFTLGLLGCGVYNYHHPETNVVSILTNKRYEDTPQAIKIVAISDVHLGNGTGKAALKKYVEMINAQHPDLILIGGDLIDNSLTPLYKENMAEELARLKAPLGIYMVPGNHEYISGIRKSMQFINETPIHLLRDEVVTLPGGIQIVGRDDRSNKDRLSLQELVKNIDPSKPVILLDHQPYNLPETENAGIDLQFSGHTHRGQVWPISLITDRMFEQSYGYRKWGNSHVYVSSGLSLWGPPFRIGTDSELVVFNITCK